MYRRVFYLIHWLGLEKFMEIIEFFAPHCESRAWTEIIFYSNGAKLMDYIDGKFQEVSPLVWIDYDLGEGFKSKCVTWHSEIEMFLQLRDIGSVHDG